ncbi:sigma-E processing peptidase SpoIIGA [Alkalithermobacter paradoxus]|uniref:Sporulation sigma-E factor-processing peptidase n=1 Tax=Alkalithermobacter paradoxus TaxID=29349 RepID=A0A1V4IAF3_9FIRM|nr:sporulation sigma-E factor-processing peptidase [[Clostridium] thermoalcaliphilum]
MTVYAEYYFLENVFMNYLIIITTCSLLNLKVNKYRVWIASILGGLYSMIYFAQNLLFLYNIYFKIIFVFLIVGVAFIYKGVKEYLRTLLTFYFVNIFLSGSIFFIIYFTGIDHMTISLIILVGFVSSRFLSNYHKVFKGIGVLKDTKQTISVQIEDKTIQCTALLDTGNLLKDPLSKDPVIIINVKKLEDILPEELIYIDYSNMDHKKADHIVNKLSLNILKRFRIIPYKVVGSEKNLIVGLKADNLDINGNKRSNIILGLSNFSKDSEYDAIVNPNIF